MAEPNVRFCRTNGSTYPDWEEKHLGDVASRVTRKNKNNETDIPLTIASIEGLVDQRTYFGKTIASKDMSGYYLLKKGEFAYNKSYSNGYDYGSIKRLDNYDMGALSTLYICFALNADENSDFFNCYFNGLSWYNQMKEICAEGARNHGLLNVSANDFFNITLSIPSSNEERQRIADFFEQVDTLIAASEQEVNKLQELKKGCLQKMFPKDGASVPEVRFPGFTDDWEQRKISDEVDSIDTGKSKFEAKEYGEYEILGSTGVIGYDATFDYEGDFLLTARVGANAGNLYRHSGKVKITDNTVFLQGSHIDFVYYLLDNFDLKKMSFGSGQPLIKASQLKSLELYMPTSSNEKIKIAAYFADLDNLITLHQRECDKYKELKKGLLQQMFV